MSDVRRRDRGWHSDRPDSRDDDSDIDERELPDKVDLREPKNGRTCGVCTPVEDQGTWNTCVPLAVISGLEFLEWDAGKDAVQLSRLFAYYNARAMALDVDRAAIPTMEALSLDDSGVQVRDAVKALKRFGVCREELWPYKLANRDSHPPESCYKDAEQHKITAFWSVQRSANQMRAHLARRCPFVFAFVVYPSYGESKNSGFVRLPGAAEEPKGWHSVLAVGYDNPGGRFLIRNSDGPGWGMGGHCWIPYDYLTNPKLAVEFRAFAIAGDGFGRKP